VRALVQLVLARRRAHLVAEVGRDRRVLLDEERVLFARLLSLRLRLLE